MTIASSLEITFISSIGATVGKITTVQVNCGPAPIMAVVSLIAAKPYAIAEKKMNTKILQVILAVLILAITVKVRLISYEQKNALLVLCFLTERCTSRAFFYCADWSITRRNMCSTFLRRSEFLLRLLSPSISLVLAYLFSFVRFLCRR